MDALHLARFIATASRGPVTIESLACPYGGPESVVQAARGSWSPARQQVVVSEVSELPYCAAHCGAGLIEDAVFLPPARVLASIREALDQAAACRLDRSAVGYECACCGSDQLELAVNVRRDPLLARWLVVRVSEAGHYCLACGDQRDAVRRPLREAERRKAEAELRAIERAEAKDIRAIRRMLDFVEL